MADKIWLGNDSGNEGDLNVAANYDPSGVPVATDNLTIPAGSNAITLNLTALNNATLSGALGKVVVEPGYAQPTGLSTADWQFSCTQFDFSGLGLSYIDLEASAIAPEIRATQSAATGYYGLNLIGSALTVVNVIGGSVALAPRITEAATIATLRVVGSTARVLVGRDVTLTTSYMTDGTVYLYCAATTATLHGGKWYSREVGAIATLNVYGGTAYPESTGTITACNCEGGTTDFTKSGDARTVTTLKQNPGATLIYDPAVLTIGTRAAPEFPISLVADSL